MEEPMEGRRVRKAAELWRQGRVVEARDILRDQALRHPRRWALLSMLARVETELGAFAEAERYARRSAELAPPEHGDVACVPLVLVLHAQGRFPEAAAEIVRCLRGPATFGEGSALVPLVAEALSELSWRDDLADYRERIVAALSEQPAVAQGVRDQLGTWGAAN
jgi:tetratricopeptide (TPR) repeat protein